MESIKYCMTKLQQLSPCNVGWGMTDSTKVTSCFDEPKEQNCHNLIFEGTIQRCPLCGQEIE